MFFQKEELFADLVLAGLKMNIKTLSNIPFKERGKRWEEEQMNYSNIEKDMDR